MLYFLLFVLNYAYSVLAIKNPSVGIWLFSSVAFILS